MKDNFCLLIVDDELIARESLSNWLREEGYQVKTSDNGWDALEMIKSHCCDLAVVDMKMPGMNGMELLQKSKEIDPSLPILIMTAYASIDTAVQAMKKGAYDYIVKPLDPENVSQVIERALKLKILEQENLHLHRELEKKYKFEEIIGKSKKMQEIFELVRSVAETDVVVMIRGESGTGKELIAKAIHINSKRKNGPLIDLSCGALPENLLESELFGYEKGAFTGAQQTRKGKIEMANGGTLFLDEIGDISSKTQMNLLRVLQEKNFYRIGSNKSVNVDIRVISATNRDLEEAVRNGIFREDLYYRLNVVDIYLPPLRERKSDIPLLADHFLQKYKRTSTKKIESISGEAMEALISYSWPGNVRELENIIERAIVIGKSDEIILEDLPINIQNGADETQSSSRTLANIEKKHIVKILHENNWNISKSAHELNIDRVTLYNKIRKYKIER
ncbi:MAG: sigma-54 dependent transcriptional regulator [Spirochaetota bacterium]|nr:sigma-54 dependent transcriptional regulator [Spirochaetota bacterium]